jgi:hypothetical protein
MSCITIVLLFAAATCAEGNLMPWQKAPALVSQGFASLKKQLADSNGRRLQSKWATPDCMEACPETMDFLTAMSSPENQEVLSGDDGAAKMAVMCPHVATMTCLATTEACVAEGEEEYLESLEAVFCGCACPSIMTAGEIGDTPTPAQCEAMTCVSGEKACATMMETVSDEDQAKMDACGGSDEPPATSDAPVQNAAFAITVMSLTAFLM